MKRPVSFPEEMALFLNGHLKYKSGPQSPHFFSSNFHFTFNMLSAVMVPEEIQLPLNCWHFFRHQKEKKKTELKLVSSNFSSHFLEGFLHNSAVVSC